MFRYVGWILFFSLLQACGKNYVPSASGQAAEVTNDYPGVVMIVMPGGAGFCTGVIVSETAVLTAAHCLLTSGRYQVTTPVGQVSTYTAMTYGTGAVDDTRDIGMLIFSSKIVTDDSQIYAIGHTANAGDKVTLVGYGCTNTTTKMGGGLKRVGTNAIDSTGDYLTLLTPNNTNSAIIGDSTQAGTCFGDSGGPLLRQAADGSMQVVGITHAGGSDSNYFYSEFTDVATHADNQGFISGVASQMNIEIAGL